MLLKRPGHALRSSICADISSNFASSPSSSVSTYIRGVSLSSQKAIQARTNAVSSCGLVMSEPADGRVLGPRAVDADVGLSAVGVVDELDGLDGVADGMFRGFADGAMAVEVVAQLAVTRTVA